MQIILPDGVVYDLDLNYSYADRLELVEYIVNKYQEYFNEYWIDVKNSNGTYNHKVKTTLDILGSYLYYASANEERKNDYPILNERQLKFRRDTEISFNLEGATQEGIKDEVNKILMDKNDKNITKTKHTKESTKKYQESRTHRLATLRIRPELRKNRVIPNESTTRKHVFYINEGSINHKCEKGDDIKINCFSAQDKDLPYINPELPFDYQWSTVFRDDTFEFKGKKYKTKNPYYHDKVYCYQQNDKIFFLDADIRVVEVEPLSHT